MLKQTPAVRHTINHTVVISALRQELRQAKVEKEDGIKHLLQIQEELKISRDMFETVSHSLDQANEMITKITNTNEKLSGKVEDTVRRVNELTSTNEKLRSEVKRMSVFEEDARRTKELETRNRELEKENSKLEMRNNDLEEKDKELRSLMEETSSLKMKNRELESQLKLLTLRSSTLEYLWCLFVIIGVSYRQLARIEVMIVISRTR